MIDLQKDAILEEAIAFASSKPPEKEDELERHFWPEILEATGASMEAIRKRIAGDTRKKQDSGQGAGGRNGKQKRPGRSRADNSKPGAHSGVNGQEVHVSDLGNAKRLVKLFGQDFRHCHPWKKDLVWDGCRWQEDQTAQLERWAKETIRAIYEEAGQAMDDGQRKILAAHALKSEDAPRIRAMVSLARSELGIPILPQEMDRNPMLINVANGTLDLELSSSVKLREHCRHDNHTKMAPTKYDPGAKCPQWDLFLNGIMDGNKDLVNYLQCAVGYALTGDVREQCLFFFYGAGANGKSTFLDAILGLLGDYACQAIPELLMARQGESHPTERADLFGRRFVSCTETEEGKRMAEALLKQLTGGDRIRARRMREDFWEFSPTHKLFLAANHKPIIRGTDHAIWRRIKLVPFNVIFSGERKDKTLSAKLKAESSGILSWAVRGCLEWQKYGLGEPEEIRQATDGYRDEMDTLARFLEDCCIFNREFRVTSKALMVAYGRWCEEGKERPMTRDGLGRRLKEKGFENKRTGPGGTTEWLGFGLNDQG